MTCLSKPNRNVTLVAPVPTRFSVERSTCVTCLDCLVRCVRFSVAHMHGARRRERLGELRTRA